MIRHLRLVNQQISRYDRDVCVGFIRDSVGSHLLPPTSLPRRATTISPFLFLSFFVHSASLSLFTILPVSYFVNESYIESSFPSSGRIERTCIPLFRSLVNEGIRIAHRRDSSIRIEEMSRLANTVIESVIRRV